MFADVLTQLFEDVAGVVEKYYHTVDTLYGSEWTQLLIHKLQVCTITAWYCHIVSCETLRGGGGGGGTSK